jgi:hypothetical protein
MTSLPQTVSVGHRWTCHLCYQRKTKYTVTHWRTQIFSCIPVCVRCVPPFVNSKDDDFWYEVKEGTSSQHRPTPEEMKEAMAERYSPDRLLPVDNVVKRRCEERGYRQKYHIDELLKHWDEERKGYDFGGERPVWNDIVGDYYYPSSIDGVNVK